MTEFLSSLPNLLLNLTEKQKLRYLLILSGVALATYIFNLILCRSDGESSLRLYEGAPKASTLVLTISFVLQGVALTLSAEFPQYRLKTVILLLVQFSVLFIGILLTCIVRMPPIPELICPIAFFLSLFWFLFISFKFLKEVGFN